MSVEAIREFLNRHAPSATGLMALGALLDAHQSDKPLDPALAARLHDLVVTLGGHGLLEGLAQQEAATLLAELRGMYWIEGKLLFEETRRPGWSHAERGILEFGGAVSAGFVQPLSRLIVPSLDGLAERLAAPGGRFLDVGVGVAGLTIAVARQWPELSIVGIDPWQPSLKLARENVEQAGLAGRIELREQGVERLEDDGRFDLVWFPTPFIPETACRTAFERIARALRPGGWVLVNCINPNLDQASAALWRVRTTLFGNGELAVEPLEELLARAGLVDVRALPTPPGSFLMLLAARRVPA
jgi:SAM-dependent methyltransferase